MVVDWDKMAMKSLQHYHCQEYGVVKIATGISYAPLVKPLLFTYVIVYWYMYRGEIITDLRMQSGGDPDHEPSS